MNPYPPQPGWLRGMVNGIDKGHTWRVLVDGTDFAVVQAPGGRYLSGQETHYGATTYYLVDKRGEPRGGTGVLRCSKVLKDGGRVGSRVLAGWRALVGDSDKAGTFAPGLP